MTFNTITTKIPKKYTLFSYDNNLKHLYFLLPKSGWSFLPALQYKEGLAILQKCLQYSSLIKNTPSETNPLRKVKRSFNIWLWTGKIDTLDESVHFILVNIMDFKRLFFSIRSNTVLKKDRWTHILYTIRKWKSWLSQK